MSYEEDRDDDTHHRAGGRCAPALGLGLGLGCGNGKWQRKLFLYLQKARMALIEAYMYASKTLREAEMGPLFLT